MIEDEDIALDVTPDSHEKKTFIKLYDNLDVEVRMQSHGSVCKILLEGTKPNIELAYNSLFNFRAAEGKLNWINDNHAFIWSSEEKMGFYFFYVDNNKHSDWARAHKISAKRLDELKATHYIFLEIKPNTDNEEYIMAPAKNKPKLDEGDFKTAAIKHAFA